MSGNSQWQGAAVKLVVTLEYTSQINNSEITVSFQRDLER